MPFNYKTIFLKEYLYDQQDFFPIGQGAFYAERHNNFNIVYDCGNWKQTKLSRKIVSQSFNKNESIKILFISHLDWDHISLLETLKNTVSSIDYVIYHYFMMNKNITE
nr:MBL fold metallo-hydrolase [Proteus mirabilis]